MRRSLFTFGLLVLTSGCATGPIDGPNAADAPAATSVPQPTGSNEAKAAQTKQVTLSVSGMT